MSLCLTGSPTFAFSTLGCKVNQYESAAIIAALVNHGFSHVPDTTIADLYIVNSCTVTGRSDYQTRQLIRRATRKNPSAPVIVTGCYAETNAKALRALEGVRLIIGNRAKDRIVEAILRLRNGECLSEDASSPTWPRYFPPPAPLPGRTRVGLKIQDGCASFCHYCIVPYARGPVRSLPPKEVLDRMATLLQGGRKEITLTGIHLGTYGKDFDDHVTLDELLAMIVARYPRIRLRLSSLEPCEVTPRLLTLITGGQTICPHLHLPIQSGDDEVLRRMNRNYDSKFIRNLVWGITDSCPEMTIGADVMVGFPGESATAFAHTYALLEELPIAYLHVFPYSPRPGTPAAAFPDHISATEKKRRVEVLRRLDRRKRETFMERFLGRPLEVLVEHRWDRQTGWMKGFSRNYLPVAIRGLTEENANTIQTVIPMRIEGGVVIGAPIDGR